MDHEGSNRIGLYQARKEPEQPLGRLNGERGKQQPKLTGRDVQAGNAHHCADGHGEAERNPDEGAHRDNAAGYDREMNGPAPLHNNDGTADRNVPVRCADAAMCTRGSPAVAASVHTGPAPARSHRP